MKISVQSIYIYTHTCTSTPTTNYFTMNERSLLVSLPKNMSVIETQKTGTRQEWLHNYAVLCWCDRTDVKGLMVEVRNDFDAIYSD
jgi:hypothetical protein